MIKNRTRSVALICAAFTTLAFPAQCHASTGRLLRGIYKTLGPTGSLIVLAVFVALLIVGLVLKARTGKKFVQKKNALQAFKSAPPNARDEAVRQLVACFLMGPTDFTPEQAAHNAEVLGFLSERVDEETKAKLKQFKDKFNQSPAKFGIMESNDMEKYIAGLAK